MRDVAEQAGVSVTTVSHVINKTRPVNPETRTRVEQAMQVLGYQPNVLARSLRRGKTHTIGVILPDNANPYFAEVARGISLAREYDDIIVAVNVGNEALVSWNDHMVPVENVIAYVRQVKAAIEQPVTVADNYVWWIEDGAPLAAEVDFLGIHTYPAWEEKTIDEALAYTIENIEDVYAALPDKPIAILEAGWATTAIEFGDRANEEAQQRYYHELHDWAAKTNTTVFFFEAFDEPWKGDPAVALGAEKHWGIFFVDRTPKRVANDLAELGGE